MTNPVMNFLALALYFIVGGLLGLRLIVIDGGADVDAALRSVDLIARLNRGRDRSGARIEEPTAFSSIVRLPAELLGDCAAFAAAGAGAIAIPPIYDRAAFTAAMQVVGDHLPVIAEVLVLPDAATAEELDNEWPAMAVPERLKQRLATDPDADARGVVRFAQAWHDRLRGLAVQAVESGIPQAERVIRDCSTLR